MTRLLLLLFLTTVLRLPTLASDGDGSVTISGELQQWHDVTLSLRGPHARETDTDPNPFTDRRMTVRWSHTDGTTYEIPGYFAADGNAANTSADSGNIWRAHFAPDRTGAWSYEISFHTGKLAAVDPDATTSPLVPYDGKKGSIDVEESDKRLPDLRARGRLNYVGKHYLQFAGSGEYFIKFGADAPETLLAYKDFDGTVEGNKQKAKRAPLKTWSPHVRDWTSGDPTWSGDRGKGLIGAINYLSSKGCNVFSFLTYNAGGDGDNVWPFVQRNEKLHYDCSKLDQWNIVFDHGNRKGMYLHFKLQETENDDNQAAPGPGKKPATVPESLDGGDLGTQRQLYCRELVARFGHHLALNWNLGEENTQTTQQQIAMAEALDRYDAYDHLIVVHTFPNQQEKTYRPLLGPDSPLAGASLQNDRLETTHLQTVQWVSESAAAGKPWIVAFDESGSASHAQCPDIGYEGFDGRDHSGKMTYTPDKVRHMTLWGTLMGGGAGNEYYFGYQYVQSDLNCEDWRSRDKSWEDGVIANRFFYDHKIPFWEMTNADELVGNPKHDNSKYCLAQPGSLYLIYLPTGQACTLNLEASPGDHSVRWFNPRTGGDLQTGSVTVVGGGSKVDLGDPPSDEGEDWLAVVRRPSL